MWGFWDKLKGFTCESCGGVFMANPAQNCFCQKCQLGHVLCPACEAVHQLPCADQDKYIAKLEASLP